MRMQVSRCIPRATHGLASLPREEAVFDINGKMLQTPGIIRALHEERQQLASGQDLAGRPLSQIRRHTATLPQRACEIHLSH